MAMTSLWISSRQHLSKTNSSDTFDAQPSKSPIVSAWSGFGTRIIMNRVVLQRRLVWQLRLPVTISCMVMSSSNPSSAAGDSVLLFRRWATGYRPQIANGNLLKYPDLKPLIGSLVVLSLYLSLPSLGFPRLGLSTYS